MRHYAARQRKTQESSKFVGYRFSCISQSLQNDKYLTGGNSLAEVRKAAFLLHTTRSTIFSTYRASSPKQIFVRDLDIRRIIHYANSYSTRAYSYTFAGGNSNKNIWNITQNRYTKNIVFPLIPREQKSFNACRTNSLEISQFLFNSLLTNNLFFTFFL